MKNTALESKIALGRIEILIGLAEERTLENSAESRRLSRRYVKLAQELSSRYKTSIPKKLKNKVCSGCGNLLVPGINCKVRLASLHGYAAYMCECGKEKHIFYKKRRSS